MYFHYFRVVEEPKPEEPKEKPETNKTEEKRPQSARPGHRTPSASKWKEEFKSRTVYDVQLM